MKQHVHPTKIIIFHDLKQKIALKFGETKKYFYLCNRFGKSGAQETTSLFKEEIILQSLSR
jgi:hypothetical protein